MFNDLRSFIEKLEADGDLCRIDARVQSRLELAEIHRRVIAAGGQDCDALRTLKHSLYF